MTTLHRPAPFSGTLFGRFRIIGGPVDSHGAPVTYACRVQFWTLRRLQVISPIRPEYGEVIGLQLNEVGALGGRATRATDVGFSALLAGDQAHFEDLTQKLILLEQRRHLLDPFADFRQFQRFVPPDRQGAITLENGSRHACTIKDMSQSGVGVESDLVPPVGTTLAIGTVVGKVVRHFPGGFAVLFAEVQDADKVASRVARGWHLVV